MFIFATAQHPTIMTKDDKNKVAFIIAIISDFSAKHNLNTAQGYRYLARYKGIDFLDEFYAVEHTLPF